MVNSPSLSGRIGAMSEMSDSNPLLSDLLVQTVDTDAIAYNVGVIKRHANVSQLMAVVKADGYAQGAAAAARAALAGGATQLGVATLREALTLRQDIELRDGDSVAAAEAHADAATPLVAREVPILAWIWHPEQRLELESALASSIQLGVPSLAHVEAATNAAESLQVRPKVTIMVDTGLGRSGFSMANGDFQAALPKIAELHKQNRLIVTGLFTHFACADDPTDPSVDSQAEKFREAIAAAEAAGLTNLVNHAANSPAALSRPDLAFDMVRPGLALYGGEPIEGKSYGLRPAMRWEGCVILVKKLPKGESVSYGLTWTAPEDTTVAVVPCGYADGMMRSASGKFEVSINGKRYPQVGRVCMDQFVINLGPDTDVTIGDTAVIVGTQEGEPTLDELAEASRTINYEILTAPKGRTRRKHIGVAADD